jgi:hypothetical protein
MKYSICRQQKEKCPFRVFDVQLDFFICNFYKEFTSMVNGGNSFGAKLLLNRACEKYQNEERRLKFISGISRKKTQDFLDNSQVGDIVFCRIAPFHKVKLLEKPLDDSKFISCEAPNGKVIRRQACHLYKISKGNYYGEYFIDDIKNEKKLLKLEYKTQYYGFRTEVEKKKNGYLLKIFGDSQQEVDDFITLSLELDFDISPYV